MRKETKTLKPGRDRTVSISRGLDRDDFGLDGGRHCIPAEALFYVPDGIQ